MLLNMIDGKIGFFLVFYYIKVYIVFEDGVWSVNKR